MKFTAFILAAAAATASAQFNPFWNNQLFPSGPGGVQPGYGVPYGVPAYQVQTPVYQVQAPLPVDPLAWERDCTWINSVNFRAALSMAVCGANICGTPNGNGGGHARAATGASSQTGYHVWGTVINRAGRVCAVAYSGTDLGQQFPYGRILSMKLANTANSLSLPGRAAPSHVRYVYPNNNRGLRIIGTDNSHYSNAAAGSSQNSEVSVSNFPAAPNAASNPAIQVGTRKKADSLWYGFSLPAEQYNPGNVDVHYQGAASNYGEACGTSRQDPMCMQKPGGIAYQAGGLPLYDAQGVLRGAIGIAGDNDCTNHAIAWKAREQMYLDYTPATGDVRNDVWNAAIVDSDKDVIAKVKAPSMNFVWWAGKRAEDNAIFSPKEQALFPACQDVISQFATTNPTEAAIFGTSAGSK